MYLAPCKTDAFVIIVVTSSCPTWNTWVWVNFKFSFFRLQILMKVMRFNLKKFKLLYLSVYNILWIMPNNNKKLLLLQYHATGNVHGISQDRKLPAVSTRVWGRATCKRASASARTRAHANTIYWLVGSLFVYPIKWLCCYTIQAVNNRRWRRNAVVLNEQQQHHSALTDILSPQRWPQRAQCENQLWLQHIPC